MISILGELSAKSAGLQCPATEISAIDESGFAAERWWAKIPNSVTAGDAGKIARRRPPNGGIISAIWRDRRGGWIQALPKEEGDQKASVNQRSMTIEACAKDSHQWLVKVGLSWRVPERTWRSAQYLSRTFDRRLKGGVLSQLNRIVWPE